jgi:hypothetical protein
MIETLIKLADRLDRKGLVHLASEVDGAILSLAMQGEIGITDLMRLLPGAKEALKRAITFDLVVEPDPDGRGNNVKAIPKIHDKWTDGLNLGDLRNAPKLEKYLTEEGRQELYSDLPMLGEHEFEYVPGKKDVRDLDKALEQAVKVWEREEMIDPSARSEEGQKLYQRHQQRLQSLEKARRQKQLGEGISGAIEAVEEGRFISPEEVERMRQTEADIRSLLVKMADNFDQTGNYDLAQEVDRTLKSFSARPKAPLKKLDDDVKKNLIVFIHDADQNNAKSIKGLNELFRRLRYFNFADTSKELGLDKVVKEMEKTQDCLDGAKKRFYEIMHGRKPSKQNLKELFEDIDEESDEQGALDFFDEQLKKEAPDDELENDEELELENEEDLGEDNVRDDEYLSFLEEIRPTIGKDPWTSKKGPKQEPTEGESYGPLEDFPKPSGVQRLDVDEDEIERFLAEIEEEDGEDL